MAAQNLKSGRIAKQLLKFSRRAQVKSETHIKRNLINRVDNVKKIRIWILEWFLLVFAIIALSAVQSIWFRNSFSTSAFVSGGEYSEAVFGKISSLNPLYASTDSERAVARLLFSSLVAIDSSGSLKNDLAETITPEEGGRVWLVRLKDGLKWSDGRSITVDDVVYTFDVIKDPKSRTAYASNFSNISLSVTGDLLRFRLPMAYAAFPSTLTFPVLPSHILSEVDNSLLSENAFSKNPIGSGPFKFDSINSSASRDIVRLSKNNTYYGGVSIVDYFSVHADSEPLDPLREISSLSVVASAPPLSNNSQKTTIPTIPTGGEILLRESPLNSGVFLFFNNTSATFSNVNLRRAVELGVDLSALRASVGETLALDFPILDSQISLTYPSRRPLNILEAKSLVASSSYDQSSHVRIVASSAEPFATLAERLKSDLANIGFIGDVYLADPNEIFATKIRPRDYDILIYEVDLGYDPDPFPYYHSSQASESGLNFSNYKNTLVDDLLLAGRTSLDVFARAKKYEKFLEIWNEDVPALGIFRISLKYYFNKNIRTFSENSRLVSPLDRFADVSVWAVEHEERFKTP
jgi:peptide/nickel transport system substrate-binding protein